MLTRIEQINSLDELYDYVNETLCEHYQLQIDAFPLTQRFLRRAGKPCGIYYCLHGPPGGEVHRDLGRPTVIRSSSTVPTGSDSRRLSSWKRLTWSPTKPAVWRKLRRNAALCRLHREQARAAESRLDAPRMVCIHRYTNRK